jgi:hypothetical protein
MSSWLCGPTRDAGPSFSKGPISGSRPGETDVTGRITKIGDRSVRTALYQAAHVILTRPMKGCLNLKSWAKKLAKRAGMKKAKVALARKLAVILHRMWHDGIPRSKSKKSLSDCASDTSTIWRDRKCRLVQSARALAELKLQA